MSKEGRTKHTTNLIGCNEIGLHESINVIKEAAQINNENVNQSNEHQTLLGSRFVEVILSIAHRIDFLNATARTHNKHVCLRERESVRTKKSWCVFVCVCLCLGIHKNGFVLFFCVFVFILWMLFVCRFFERLG